MKCPNCGNTVPEGSAFCNKCGSALSMEQQCPSCGNTIPADSVFCPKCGKMVRNDMASGETFNQQQERLRQQQEAAAVAAQQEAERQAQAAARQREEALRQQQAAAQRQQQQRTQQSNPWEQPSQGNDDDDRVPQSNFNRNLIMGIAIVAGVVILLMLMRTCGGESDRNRGADGDSTQVEMAMNGQDALTIFNSEMGRSNYMGDGANTAWAVDVPEHSGKPRYIVGVTYKSDPTNRSFFKIYKLTQNGQAWVLEQLHTQYINGRAISFDNAELIAAENQTPRAVTIDGRDYLYMAYANMPQGSHVGGTGRVSLSLYDVDNKQLTTLDYDGIITVREDGRQYVYGKPLQSVNSSLTRFLAQEAQSVKVIYFPTAEELKAKQEEEAAKEAAEDTNKPNGDENPNENWSADNADKMASVKNGEETTIKSKTYDNPIFKMEDKHKSVQNSEFVVFSDKTGGVYGFNKSTRKYFVIYKPSGSTSPTDIGFADTENSILNMKTASGRLQYDLKSGKLKSNNE